MLSEAAWKFGPACKTLARLLFILSGRTSVTSLWPLPLLVGEPSNRVARLGGVLHFHWSPMVCQEENKMCLDSENKKQQSAPRTKEGDNYCPHKEPRVDGFFLSLFS